MLEDTDDSSSSQRSERYSSFTKERLDAFVHTIYIQDGGCCFERTLLVESTDCEMRIDEGIAIHNSHSATVRSSESRTVKIQECHVVLPVLDFSPEKPGLFTVRADSKPAQSPGY